MSGRHFLQIPGPTNIPDRILRAISFPTMDHRSPEFGAVALEILSRLKGVFGCSGPAFIYPASGTGAWEASLVNVLSPGDRLLMFEGGHFAKLWGELAVNLGFRAEVLRGDWRAGADPQMIEDALRADRSRSLKAVCIVHNETSTGCVSPIAEIREAIDRARHPSLLIVDTISSLGSVDYRHDEWRVDVSVGCSQKGLMLPPGLSFNAVSERALAAAKKASGPRSYWSWQAMLGPNRTGHFPYTPSTNLLFGLREALAMISETGLSSIFARHLRHARATRAAVATWGLDTVCANPAHYSPVLTAVMTPEGYSADAFRANVSKHFNMSLGNGLSRLADRAFRIGHLGDFNDLMLAGTLSGVEMGLALSGVPHRAGGVQAALLDLRETLSRPAEESRARQTIAAQ